MKNKDDKNLESLVERLMAESDLESPSVDFTGKVMSEVFSFETNKNPVYKPLISKRAWLIIFAGIIALFAFLFLNIKPSASSKYFNFSFFDFTQFFQPFSHFQISSMTTNVLLAAALMLFIQLFLLKNYLNKRFEK